MSRLSYIIIQRPLYRPLDLLIGMIDRHPVEITVMQFTGLSLPVHQSMSVPWDFFSSSHFISQFPPTRFPLITAIRMCHFFPVHHLGMAFLAGSEAKIQQSSVNYFSKFHMWNFPSCSSPSPSHIFYRIIYKDSNGCKHKKNHLNYSKQNLT